MLLLSDTRHSFLLYLHLLPYSKLEVVFYVFCLEKDFQSIPLPDSEINTTIVMKTPFPNNTAASFPRMKMFYF